MGINFNKADFEQLDFKYIIVNQTSGTELKNYKKIWVELFTDKGFTLVLPKNSCNTGHSLLVMFFEGRKPKIPKVLPKSGNGRGVSYSLMGKVKSKSDHAAQSDLSVIELQFTQYDSDGWADFVGKYKKKQDEITKTLECIQVYEE